MPFIAGMEDAASITSRLSNNDGDTKMNTKILAVTMVGVLSWNSSFAALAPIQNPTQFTNLTEEQTSKEINAEDILADQHSLRAEITAALKNQMLLDELAKRGVTKNEVQLRLAAMSDQELLQVQNGIQRQAGGDVIVLSVTAFLLIIIAILLLVR